MLHLMDKNYTFTLKGLVLTRPMCSFAIANSIIVSRENSREQSDMGLHYLHKPIYLNTLNYPYSANIFLF